MKKIYSTPSSRTRIVHTINIICQSPTRDLQKISPQTTTGTPDETEEFNGVFDSKERSSIWDD